MFQPVVQFISFLIAQTTLFYGGLMAWMLMFSSVISHSIFNFVHIYLYQWTCGLPAAMPRPVTSARSQIYRFYRTMAEPTICQWRDKLKKKGDRSRHNGSGNTGQSKGL
jgi:hypothetical protein